MSKRIDLSKITTERLIAELEKRNNKNRAEKLKNEYIRIKEYCKLKNLQPTYKIDTEDGYDMINNSYFWIGVILPNGEHIDYYDFGFDENYDPFDHENLIPSGFAESSESHYEFRGPAEKAIDILKQCGYIEFVENI